MLINHDILNKNPTQKCSNNKISQEKEFKPNFQAQKTKNGSWEFHQIPYGHSSKW